MCELCTFSSHINYVKQPAEAIFDGSAYLCFGNISLNTLRCYFNFRMVVREQRCYHITKQLATVMNVIYFDAQIMMVCWQRTLAFWLLCMAN